MLSVLKITVSYVLHFVCFRWEDKPGSFILPLEVEFLILYVFDCSIHISNLPCVRLCVEEKAHKAIPPTSDLTGSPHPCPHPCFYLFIWLFQVLVEACGV